MVVVGGWRFSRATTGMPLSASTRLLPYDDRPDRRGRYGGIASCPKIRLYREPPTTNHEPLLERAFFREHFLRDPERLDAGRDPGVHGDLNQRVANFLGRAAVA